MGVAVANRDLRLGRFYMVTLEDEVAEAVGDALNADESGVAVARRRPRQFTFTFPIRGASADANPYASGDRMRRQIRAMMENTTLRLQGLYMSFAQDHEIDGWIVAGSGLLKYDNYGLTFASYAIELDSSYRVGGLRTHLPARRIELYDRRISSTPRDFKGIIFGTDFSGITPLALSSLPVGASNPIGYLGVPVVAYARAGFDGTGYVLQGMQHGQVIGFEQEATRQNLGDVVLYDRRGLTAETPEVGNRTNYIENPNFEYDTAGNAPALWSSSAFSLNAGATLTATAAQAQEGKQSMKVVTTNSAVAQGACIACPGIPTFLSGTTYHASMWLRGNVGGERVNLALGNTADDQANVEVTLTASWQQVTIAWTPSSNRSGTTHGLAIRSLNAEALTWFVDSVMVVAGALPATTITGDSYGYFWQAGFGQSQSTIDPQSFGWEEVYGPDQKLSSGDVVVMQNQLCRLRYVSATTSIAIDTSVEGTWTEQGRVTLWDSGALDTYTQHTKLLARSDGSLSTVMEWTPERAIVRLSSNRSGADSTARLDTYITLQRGWTGPRIESYCNIAGVGTPGCQVRWTPNSTGNYVEANLTSATPIFAGGDALFGWASSPGPTYQEVGEPWVDLIPAAGGQMVTLTSIQRGARGPNYEDNAAYGSTNRQSASVCARFGENQNNTATTSTYGYVSAHLGFTAKQLNLGVLEAETWRLVRSGCTEVADAAASAGHAINDTQVSVLQPPVQANLASSGTGGGLAAATYFYKVTAKNGAGETIASNEKSITVTGSSSKITVSWAEVPGATAYVVYRGTVTNTENVKHEVTGGSTVSLEDTGASIATFPEALSVADTLLRTESPLSNGGKWATLNGAANAGTSNVTNGWEGSAFGTVSGARWTPVEQANPAVTLTLHTGTPASERWFSVVACWAAAATSGYEVRLTESAVVGTYTCTIEKYVAGALTTLATITGVSFTTGNTLGIAVRGGKVAAWKKVGATWSLIGEAADATYTTGYTGIVSSGSNPFYDNFSFGEATAPTTGTTFTSGSPPGSNTATVTTAASLLISAAELNAKNMPVGRYGIWARVRTTTSGDTLSITGGFAANQTAVKTSTSNTYTWLYLGESLRETTSQEYSMTIYQSAGSGLTGMRLDRVVALPSEYRQTGNPTFDGGRDLAVVHLYDSQVTPDLVER